MNRKTPFANEEHYHIYNRGASKQKIFLDMRDFERFLLYFKLMNDEQDGLVIRWREFHKNNPKISVDDFLRSHLRKRKPLVKIIAYCINPNHYHLILGQEKENGITDFMRKLGTGYTMYFNKKYKHSGVIFQGRFKSVYIDDNDYLLYLSAYVNKNYFIHNSGKGNNIRSWRYCSLDEYSHSEKKKGELCEKEIVLGQFSNAGEYLIFAKNNALYMKEKKELEKYIIEI
jgi:putative transposase